MESIKNAISNKTSLILNKNTKKQNSIKNLRQCIKPNETKNKYLVNNAQNRPSKGMSLLSQKNSKPKQTSKNKPMNINNEESLSKNLLIRALSYKNIDKDENKNKNGTKLLVNKKIKKDLFEYKTQKIIQDINKDLNNNNNLNLNKNYYYNLKK